MKHPLLRRSVLLVLTAASLILFATLAFSQGIVTGTIIGNVVDPQGAAVSGARITAHNVATNQDFTTTTTDVGIFAVRQLPPGRYTVTIEAVNFQKLEVADNIVEVAKETSLANLKLAVGASTEVVNVEGASPLIETGTSQITESFESKKVQELPIGVGFDQLALFTPGVASVGSMSFTNSNGAQFSANGQRARSNNFQIDGQGMNDPSVAGPAIFLENPDVVAEYQVITQYSAEYGRNSGSQVNIITKNGTNQFHGTAYENYRGSRFDSLTNQEKSPIFGYCTPNQAVGTNGCKEPKVTRYVRNLFGFSAGGPIKKDKVWFFGSGDWDRTRTAGAPITSGSLLAPDANGVAALAAAFPNSPAVGYLKTFGPQATAGNPTFSGIKMVPVTVNGTTVQTEMGVVSRNIPSVSNIRQFTGRIDYQLTERDRFFGRYVIDDEISTNLDYGQGPSGFVVDVPSRSQQIGLDWTHQFSDRLLNQARINYTRLNLGFENGTSGCNRQTFTACATNIAFADSTLLSYGLNTNLPQGRLNNTYQTQDNASLLRGRHQFKWGGEYDHANSPNTFLPNYNGGYTFASFSSFISNAPSQLLLADGPYKIAYHEQDVAAYFQDDWRVKDNLTLNLGLRWEWNQQAVNELHDLSVAQQTGPNPFWNTALPLSRTTVPEVPQDLNNFGPNIGFAYTPRIGSGFLGDGKTVLRGGFRIAYDPSFYNMFLNVASTSPVVNSATILTNVPGLPSSGFTGAAVRTVGLASMPTGVDPGLRSQTWIASNLHNPYTEQWSLGIQREITSRIAAEVRYVGNHSIGLFQSVNENPSVTGLINNGFAGLLPAGTAPCSDPTQPGYAKGYIHCANTNVTERGNYAWSKYNGLQSQLTMRAFHGVTTSLAYTWSHTMDNASEVYSTTGAGQFSLAPDAFNTNTLERANSNLDFPNTVGLQVIYDLPFYHDQHGVAGKLLGGWEASTTYRYSSGQPYTPYQAKQAGSYCDPTNVFSGSIDACRPILANASAPINTVGIITAMTGGTPTVMQLDANSKPTIGSSITSVHWLVNNANAAAYYGSPWAAMVRRNTLRGMTVNNPNLAFLKNTKLTERFNMQFRAIAYNVLNRQYLGLPGSAITTQNSFQNWNYANAGGGANDTIENGIGRRRLEFGAKLIF